MYNRKQRSAVTKKQWRNSIVAAKRAERTNVRVQGHGKFRSVGAAFRALDIPLARMIRFRIALKRAGTLCYTHKGIPYRFRVVPTKAKEVTT